MVGGYTFYILHLLHTRLRWLLDFWPLTLFFSSSEHCWWSAVSSLYWYHLKSNSLYRPIARICWMEVTQMCACQHACITSLHMHARLERVWGHAPLGNFWSKIASEAILEQMSQCVLKKNGMTQGSSVAAYCWQWLNRRLTDELSSAWNGELFTHVFVCILSPQRHYCLIHSCSAFTCWSSKNKKVVLATIKLDWTVVIFNGNEAIVNHLQTVGYLKWIARCCIKSFEG